VEGHQVGANHQETPSLRVEVRTIFNKQLGESGQVAVSDRTAEDPHRGDRPISGEKPGRLLPGSGEHLELSDRRPDGR